MRITLSDAGEYRDAELALNTIKLKRRALKGIKMALPELPAAEKPAA